MYFRAVLRHLSYDTDSKHASVCSITKRNDGIKNKLKTTCSSAHSATPKETVKNTVYFSVTTKCTM